MSKERFIYLVAGVVLGAGVSSIIWSRYADKREFEAFEEGREKEINHQKAFKRTMDPNHPEHFHVADYLQKEFEKAKEELREEEIEEVTELIKELEYDDIGEDLEKDFETTNYLSNRDKSKPYLISVDEFQEQHVVGDDAHDKYTFRYFSDGVVADDDTDRVLDNHEEFMGTEFQDRFGFLSESKEVVYVRNENNQVDYEIVKDDQTYTEYMSGYNDEEEEKIRPKRKNRNEDE